MPVGLGRERVLMALAKNDFTRSGEINLQQTEKQPENQEVETVNGDLLLSF